MIPISFTVKDGVTTFHYKYSELKEFLKLGFANGNVDKIVTKRKGNTVTHKGFGTINNPHTEIFSFDITELESFAGKMPTDEERLLPPKPLYNIESFGFIFPEPKINQDGN